MIRTRRIVFEEPSDELIVIKRSHKHRPAVSRSFTHPYSRLVIADDMAEKIMSSKKQKRNKVDGSFYVLLDEDNVYLKNLVDEAQNLGLTVSGDGTNNVKGGDIREAKYGDIITFGSSTRFDVNWIKRSQYACERSLIPIHKISDWDTVMSALKAFAKEKKQLKNTLGWYYDVSPKDTFKDLKATTRRSSTYNCGCSRRVLEVEDCRGIKGRLHDDFIKVGFDFIKVEKPCWRKEREEYIVLV